ncbi:MAG TPA: S8 family serine peptidase [Rhizobacter sp.]|nr:S8 family serine peptidase [Rhizobacter sp.]
MLLPAGWQATQAQTAPSVVTDTPQARVIVKFKADSNILRRQALSTQRSTEQAALLLGQRLDMPLTAGHEIGERTQVVMGSGMSSAALAAKLSTQEDIEYAVPDQRRYRNAAPNDPLYANGLGGAGPASGQWYLRPPTTTVRSAIDAETAWDTTTGSASVVVAVLDTGVRYDHPDLQAVASGGNLLPGYDMVSPETGGGTFRIANDNNGRDPDASDPGDWVSSADISSGGPFSGCVVESSSWHGTETSGLIGALTNNGIGMAGVGRNVRVLPVRVLGKCGGFDSDIIAGMRWAVNLSVSGVPANPTPAKVLNLSLGAPGACTQAYIDAITAVTAQGAVVVVAAGNSAGHALSSPANCPGVVAVAGLRHTGTKVGFSDLGTNVTLSAPAGNCVNSSGNCLYPIITTRNSGLTTPVAADAAYSDGGANASVGTSFSAPLVAGTAALVFSTNPSLTVAQVKTILQSTARAFPTSGSDTPNVPVCQAPTTIEQDECYCTTSTCGAGMLDAAASVGFAFKGVLPKISLTGTAIEAQLLELTGTDSLLLPPRTITGYQWTLVDGGGTVTTLVPTADPAKVNVTPSAPGSFTVRLTVTSDQSQTATTTRTVVVAATPAPSGGGGGGALGLPWLSGLLAGTLALQALRWREQPKRAV